jgi:hypothetical protein
MTKEPVPLPTLLHIYPVSCFIGDVPLIGYAKLSCHTPHLIELGVFGRHFAIEISGGHYIDGINEGA